MFYPTLSASNYCAKTIELVNSIDKCVDILLLNRYTV
jgi:hypothetical protein